MSAGMLKLASTISRATVSRSTETSISRTTSLLFHFWFGHSCANRHVAPLVDHERAKKLDHDLSRFGETGGLHLDDADVRSRFRFALVEHFAPRVDRLAFEQRIRQAHFIPTEVRHNVDREIDHGLAGDECEREGGIDQRL